MKADLFLAPVHTAGFGALAHRTAAGFVVLASPDAGDVIELLTERQNEADVIDQLVARVRATQPEAFALLFTAGGDLFFLAWGVAVAQITSVSTQLAMSAAHGQVLVHPVSAGINETAARIRLYIVDPGAAATAAIDLRAGTIEAAWLEVLIGDPATLAPPPAPVPAPLVAPTPAPRPEPEPVVLAVAEPPPVPIAIIDPEEPPPAAREIVFADDLGQSHPVPDDLATKQGAIHRLETEPPAPTVGAVMVLGVTCPAGHHNHPDGLFCSQCGTALGEHATTVLINGPRPPLGVLVVDDGSTFSLHQDMIIGREPTSHDDVLAGAASPMILTDDTVSMSRKHARIALVDWAVNVIDLNSSNGTWLSRAGLEPSWSRLEAGSPTELMSGDRLRIGGRFIQVELHHMVARP